MDLYVKKNRWKLFLLLLGAIIGIISILYSNYITSRLADEEKKKVELWAEAMKRLTSSNDEQHDIDFVFKVIENNTTIPVVVVDTANNLIFYRNIDSVIVTNKNKLKKELEEMASVHDPIEINVTQDIKQYVYYKNSVLLQQLKIFPYLQLFLIIVFIGLSYYAFSTTRRAEQNQVWVGLSKETAHQLGTPISSLSGWVELLKMDENIDKHVISELDKDVKRLELIANRFSKVGSKPSLKPINIVDIISNTIDYLKPRVSVKVNFNLDIPKNEILIPVNEVLFSWVLENIIKNSIDAMPNGGEISIKIKEDENNVVIDIKDTGTGIPKKQQKSIFKPGYTTKTRGWGLGLSLAKRIIEIYHQGKIFVKSSIPGQGTIMRIMLRKNN